MSVAFTSRIALKSIHEELSDLQRAVWEAIRDWSADEGPAIQDLASHLRRKEASICGRINELREAGAIQDGPLKMGGCGKSVKTYQALVWREPADDRAQLQLL